MCEELRLERYDNSPWGFRLTGGLDFGTPLSIIKVTGGSIAELSGVQAGDLVKAINGRPTKHFTHLDAQKCIAASGNYITLTVLRGSLVTPPVTPICGRTPVPDSQEELIYHSSPPTIMKTDVENEIMNYYKATDMKDGLRSPVTVRQKTAQKATISSTNQKYSVNEEGDLLLGDRALTDFEIAELLTSNEEVLDEGILGINFKKFLPKVDFIRNSEVFKLLQNENTKKELSEQAQLQKEPSKRFSTFLMKPKGPPEENKGPTFVRFKPPRYLPKPPEKKWELPKLKPWERPKREEPGHSVLWLFLEEKGEEIIDERWGTDEEERLNMSRNSYIEYEHSEISSSARALDDDTCSISSRDQLESSLSKHDDLDYKHVEESSQMKERLQGKERIQCDEQRIGKFKIEAQIESIDYNLEDINQAGLEQSTSAGDHLVYSESHSALNTGNVELCILPKVTVSSDKTCSSEEVHSSSISKKLVSQLAEITKQIEALENEAPSELMTQLLEVKEQLIKLNRIQSTKSVEKKEGVERQEHEVAETYEEPVVEYTIARTPISEISLCQSSQFLEECKAQEEFINTHSHHETHVDHQEMNSVHQMQSQKTLSSSQIQEAQATEITELVQQQSEKHVEVSTYQVEELQETEFQLCVAPQPSPQQQKKKVAHPITPQRRPIVLPGGRMWRKPKDAEHEDFYQGVLVAQAEVLIGSSNEGVNFTKYVPPSVDMSTSEVYRLIHETEDKHKEVTQDTIPNGEYCQPISKRHFYAATLREPAPIGLVELSDL